MAGAEECLSGIEISPAQDQDQAEIDGILDIVVGKRFNFDLDPRSMPDLFTAPIV
jgi:hypothetical protein